MRTAFAAGLAFVALQACSTPASVPILPAGGPSVEVVDRGWHTDIALPVDRLSGPLARLARDYPGARVLEFGFGDRAFYMARDVDFGQAIAALFPGPGVILLTTLRVPAGEAFGPARVVTLHLSPAGFANLAGFVWRAVAKQPDGTPVRLGDGPYPGSVFYASGQTYDALSDCNAWTADALAAGGLPIDPRGVLFAGQLMAQVRRVAAGQAQRH